MQSLLKQCQKITGTEGLIYRIIDDVHTGECHQLLLPACLTEQVLNNIQSNGASGYRENLRPIEAEMFLGRHVQGCGIVGEKM